MASEKDSEVDESVAGTPFVARRYQNLNEFFRNIKWSINFVGYYKGSW
jgi:hypothetical protein